MKQTITLAIFLVGIFLSTKGQNFKQQYKDLDSKNDTVAQLELLQKWEAADSSDPEMYVAYFNFYVSKSKRNMIEVGNNPKGENVLQLMDTDTTKKEPVAYMYDNTSYDPIFLKKGFDYADKGISKNPTRLDIRFGKTYMFGELEDWKNFTAEIIKAIDYSATIKNKWIWTDNNPVEGDPKEFMLSSIQSYQLQLYNTNNDTLLDNMKQIAEEILKYYPEHVESLSNLSVVYMINKDYDKALEQLLKAESFAPTDFIVLNNIAEAYKRKGDNVSAIKYFDKVVKYGDVDAKATAKEQINKLNKK